MANKIITITQILADLNKNLSVPDWVALPGVYSLPLAKIPDNNSVASEGSSMVLKAFYNKRTAEFKTYVAKVTDEPETFNLI